MFLLEPHSAFPTLNNKIIQDLITQPYNTSAVIVLLVRRCNPELSCFVYPLQCCICSKDAAVIVPLSYYTVRMLSFAIILFIFVSCASAAVLSLITQLYC